MKRSVIGLFISALILSSIGLAAADDGYGVTVVTKITSRYVLQDLGIEASKEPGVVTDLAITRGHWTFDWWQRVDLADGEYGERGSGDEHDLTVTYNRQFGQFSFEGSAAYFFLAPLGGDNDGVQLYADLGRPIALKWGISVTPAVRVIEFIGLDAMSSFTQLRYRMPIAVPVLKQLTIVFDPSVTATVTRGPEHDWVFRPTASAVWQVNDALSLQLDVKDTNHTAAEIDFGLIYKF